MRKLYFLEYMQVTSGIPVDMSIGIQSIAQGIWHGRKVCADNDYCGFWISVKNEGTTEMPRRIEFHSVTRDPSGKRTVFGKPIKALSKSTL